MKQKESVKSTHVGVACACGESFEKKNLLLRAIFYIYNSLCNKWVIKYNL